MSEMDPLLSVKGSAMIHKISHMVSGPDLLSSPDGKIWFRAVPSPFPDGFLGRIKNAWYVIRGKAYAIEWPKAGDLEKALDREVKD